MAKQDKTIPAIDPNQVMLDCSPSTSPNARNESTATARLGGPRSCLRMPA